MTWERTDDGLAGWITTRPTPLKLAHLAHSPHVSCSYWDATQDTAIAECDAGVLRLRPWRLRVATLETLLGRAPVLTWDRRSLEECPTS